MVPLSVIKEVGVLTPLTSSKADFSPTEDHKRAFLHLKELLTSEPLYCNLINETAEKFLWVDAATSSGVLGGVLAQRIKGESVESALEMCPLTGNGRFVYPNGTLMFQCCSIFVTRFIACKLLKGESVDNDLEMYHSTVLVKFVELWYCDGRLFCELQEVCVMDGTSLELFFHLSNWVIQGTLPPLKWRG